jgi:2-phosphoglycerate kinase
LLRKVIKEQHYLTMSFESNRTQTKETRSAIILLSGVPGTGKTTLGNALQNRLGLSHRLSTGFLRASIDSLIPESNARLLRREAFAAYEETSHSSSPTGQEILEGCARQANILKPVFKSCVARARTEGIGLIMEGSHFIPGIIDPNEFGADLLCVLDVPDREQLKERALSPNHRHRKWSNFDLNRLSILQDQLVYMANKNGLPIIINTDVEQSINHIIALLNKKTSM